MANLANQKRKWEAIAGHMHHVAIKLKLVLAAFQLVGSVFTHGHSHYHVGFIVIHATVTIALPLFNTEGLDISGW